MAIQTVMTATMMCTMGTAPSTLLPTPKTVMSGNQIAANIMDFAPIVNVPPFGMCICPANPMVAAATAAAMGVLTPMPCIPVPTGPWVPGAPTVMLCGSPALNNSSKLMCAWTGVISITVPGQMTHMIP